mgnify:CR=1 FL=1
MALPAWAARIVQVPVVTRVTLVPATVHTGVVSDEKLTAEPGLEGRLTDYSIGTTIIYAGFGWSQAERATEVFCALAAEHKVAVALVSHDSPVPPIVRP